MDSKVAGELRRANSGPKWRRTRSGGSRREEREGGAGARDENNTARVVLRRGGRSLGKGEGRTEACRDAAGRRAAA
jgi:hypothetical protein